MSTTVHNANRKRKVLLTLLLLMTMVAAMPTSQTTSSAMPAGNKFSNLEASIQSNSAEAFRDSLKLLLDDEVRKLGTRVGLVPNYFMTRGEDTKRPFESPKTFGRKCAEKIYKTFHRKDFREEEALESFERILSLMEEATNLQDTDSAYEIFAQEVLNRRCYRHGDTLLHCLVRKRHLRLFRRLLLHGSKFLDFELVNSKGFRPIDLAFDRLEVEMVYLLLLHGARLPDRGPSKNSLGYGEWIGYDLLQNLDTGRWLHRQSEESIMEYGEKTIQEGHLRDNLLDWTEGRTQIIENTRLAQLGRLPKLFALVLADGCDAITNHEAFATLIRHLKNLRDKTHGARPDSEKATPPDSFPDPKVCDNLFELLAIHGADTSQFRVAGRTIFFQTSGESGEIALKISKTAENTRTPHPLAKEAELNAFLHTLKSQYDLRSDFPKTLDLLQARSLPPALRDAIVGQYSAGYHPFSIPEEGEEIVMLIYRPPPGYGVYANDPSIAMEASVAGIQKAAYDAAVLARHGLYHAALVDIQHDSSREERPHLWSFESFLTRFRGGAGRIERGFAGLGAPNVRVSGMADLKHIIAEGQVEARYDPSRIHAQHNILYNNEERTQVALVEQLGASLFATTLLVASSWQSRYCAGVPEADNLDLQIELRNCFSSFLQGYLDLSEKRAIEFLNLVGVDFDLMAQQIKLFSTKKYVEIAETAPKRPLFGVFARLFGWCSHPTAFVHFCQRGSLDLTQPGRSLEAIRNAYSGGDTEEEGEAYPRIDTSMMRCSPTWVKGKGWVSSPQQGGQAHLGSYEGVLPFQTLIRDIYAVAYLSWLIRHDGEDAFEIAR